MAAISRDDLIQPCSPCGGRGAIDTSNGREDPNLDFIKPCTACWCTGQVLTEAGQLAQREIANLLEWQQRERSEDRSWRSKGLY